jgi:glycosyltransferase involved in cell wall biosynthesis
MRVGVVAEQLRQRVPGGIGTYTSGLLGGLVALEDPSLTVLALTSRAPSDDPLRALGVEVLSSPLGHRAQVKLWELGRGRPRGRVDVLHLTSMAGPLAKGDPPTSVMVHDLAWRTHPELTTPRGARWHEAGLARAKRSAQAFVTPSEEVARLLEDDGVARERVAVIGEGSDHLPSPDHEGALDLLDAHGVTAPFFLSVSTVEPRKNLRRLLAAHGAPSALRDVPLVVVGPQGWGPELTAERGAILVGAQPGAILAALYERCACFVYVPVTEGFGLPPLEALAHGARVIASSSVPSVRQAPDVLVVDPTDVEAISSALEEALREGEQPARRERARDFADAHRWRDVAREHLELWERLR